MSRHTRILSRALTDARLQTLATTMGWTPRETVGTLTWLWANSQAKLATQGTAADIASWALAASPEEGESIVKALERAAYIEPVVGSTEFRIKGNETHVRRQVRGRRQSEAKPTVRLADSESPIVGRATSPAAPLSVAVRQPTRRREAPRIAEPTTTTSDLSKENAGTETRVNAIAEPAKPPTPSVCDAVPQATNAVGAIASSVVQVVEGHRLCFSDGKKHDTAVCERCAEMFLRRDGKVLVNVLVPLENSPAGFHHEWYADVVPCTGRKARKRRVVEGHIFAAFGKALSDMAPAMAKMCSGATVDTMEFEGSQLSLVPESITESQRKVEENRKRCPTPYIWKAYKDAYEKRYGVSPERNAKVNSQIRSLNEQLGVDKAEAVVQYYVERNDAPYVNSAHCIGMCLVQAQKLVTEMTTGKVMTFSSAKRAEVHDETDRAVRQYLMQQEGANAAEAVS